MVIHSLSEPEGHLELLLGSLDSSQRPLEYPEGPLV